MLNDVINYIKDHQAKTGVFYEVQDQETKEIVGTNIVSDIFIENLDLDCLWDFDKALLVGLDYTIARGGNLEPFIGVSAGLDRIEKIDKGELGESLVGIQAGVRF